MAEQPAAAQSVTGSIPAQIIFLCDLQIVDHQIVIRKKILKNNENTISIL